MEIPALPPEFSFLIALIAGEVIDSRAVPQRMPGSGGIWAWTWRAAVVGWIWLTAFGLTGRPLFALAATVVTVAVLVVISNLKHGALKEPLTFADFALLEHVLRHPGLFYLRGHWRNATFAIAVLLPFVIAVWMTVEPATGGAARSLALAGAVLLAVAPLLPSLHGLFAAAAARLAPRPDLANDVQRVGLLASLAAYAVAWRWQEPAARQASAAGQTSRLHIIVAIQAEAFVDLRRMGSADLRLPAFDRLKTQAIASGLIEVPCQGGYTLRPESAVLSGTGFADQRFDGFHPYLRPQRLRAGALPLRLAQAGWDTLFVHPFDPRFFRRHRAVPELGFARFADESEFRDAPRSGPYVSDDAVADRLIEAIRASVRDERPLFAFAATMEAHEPYGPGRNVGDGDPVRQYLLHLRNADRMLERVAGALAAADRPALLVWFGDHVPLLPGFADPFPDPRTDFVAVEFGVPPRDDATAPITRPEHLNELIVSRLRA